MFLVIRFYCFCIRKAPYHSYIGGGICVYLSVTQHAHLTMPSPKNGSDVCHNKLLHCPRSLLFREGVGAILIGLPVTPDLTPPIPRSGGVHNI